MLLGRGTPGFCKEGAPRCPRHKHKAPRVASTPLPRNHTSIRAPQIVCRAEEFGLAPAKPKTAYGEMLQYYLKMEPGLFKSAVEDQLDRLKEEKEAREAAEEKRKEAAGAEDATSSTDVALYRRMEEVKASETRATLEDLMYISILEKFLLLGVDMLPRMDGFVEAGPVNLQSLTEGIHSKEALELVREHLMSVMGAATLKQFSNAALKMSKFQMVQVYAASIMFGYFLRRVDRRFQLEKSIGSLMLDKDEAVARLEKLFAAADSEEGEWDASENVEQSSRSSFEGGASNSSSSRSSSSSTSSTSSSASSSGGSSSGGSSKDLPARKEKSALKKYVEGFDQAAMVETARIVSAEGAALVERQTTALLGDIKQLSKEIQEAVGKDASSMEEVMTRMAKAVESDSVQTLTMTVGTQKRAVLEAVAFGTFLRDVESWVGDEYSLLTPMPAIRLPPGDIGGKGGRQIQSDDD